MIAFDDGRWPIVTVARENVFTMADASAQLIACDTLLRRREPFVFSVTFLPGSVPIVRDAGADAFAARWLEAIRPMLETWCRGCAVIGSDPPDSEPLIAALAGTGCPIASFRDAESAEPWLVDCLSDAQPIHRSHDTTDHDEVSR